MPDSSEELQDHLLKLIEKSRLLRKQAQEVENEAVALTERIAASRTGDRPQPQANNSNAGSKRDAKN